MSSRLRSGSQWTKAALIFRQDTETVGTEGVAGDPHGDLVRRYELAVDDLLWLEAEGPVVEQAVDHAVREGNVVGVAEREQWLGPGLDTQFLARLASRSLVEG